jgi:hypothetical protein
VLYGIQHGAGEQAEMPVSGSAGLGLRFMPGTSAVMPVPQVNGSSGPPGGQGEAGGEMVGSPRQRAGPTLRARGGDGKAAAEDAALAGINAYLCNHPAASVPVIGDHPGSVRLIKHMGPTGSTRINRR